MKKKLHSLFILLATAGISGASIAQSFFESTTYRGAFAPAPVDMWTNGWANWDPQSTVYGTPNVVVTASITTNTTWTSGNIYLLQGQIYVKNGAILTIEPGTVVMGDASVLGSGLFITQGSQINAAGTASSPIVFTSSQAPGSRTRGSWGGVILLGRSYNNLPLGTGNIEGIAPNPDTQYGGGTSPIVNDNSGILKYVRIEFPGYVYQTDKEINGLTLGSVGSATTLDFIQVSFCNDDSFEWFGGTVNAKHLIAYRGLEDDFDTDNGFSGKIQFGLAVKESLVADNPAISTSEGFESDNDASASNTTPKTAAIFSNMTLIGPYRGDLATPIATGHRRGARLRRNTELKIYNSIFMDFARGVHVDGAPCETNATNGSLKFVGNLIAGTLANKITEKNSGSTFNITAWFGANGNDSLISTSGILTTPYNYTSPDYRPAGPQALSGTNFIDAGIQPFVMLAPTVALTNVSYCENEASSALTATPSEGNTIYWYTAPIGGIGTSSNPIPNTSVAGTFTYYVGQSNASGLESPRVMVEVTVNPNPTAPIIGTSGSTTFCTGGSVSLTAPTGFTYLWSNTLMTQTINVTASGMYSVTITDENGCFAISPAITTNVSSAPSPTVTIGGATAICSVDSVTLTASTSDSYLWTTGETSQSIVVNTTGNYSVTVTNLDVCNGVGTSTPISISVTQQPVINSIGSSVSGNVVSFSQSSTNATNYSWDFADFSSSSAANPVHAYVTSETYLVTFTASNGICSADSTIEVSITLGLNEIERSVELYPIPVLSNLTIKTTSELIAIRILDLNGKVIESIDSIYSNNFSLDCSHYSNGTYLIEITTEEGTIRRNISK
jgi:hypothetical protein